MLRPDHKLPLNKIHCPSPITIFEKSARPSEPTRSMLPR
jgi:hypothetical protein